MLGAPLVLIAVLAADAGTRWDAVFLQTEAKSSEARSRCVENVTNATAIEASDPAQAVKRASAAIESAAPIRDELDFFMASPGAAASMGPARAARLQVLSAELLECVRSADFLIAGIRRANLKKAPGSEPARRDADAAFRHYLERYPSHPSAETVKGWLQDLDQRPAK